MTEETYYVRWRGRKSGPYSLTALHNMLARDELSLLHQVEIHGKCYSLEEHLKSAQSPAVVSNEAVVSVPVGHEAPSESKPPPVPPAEKFYIAKDGVKQGPFAKSVVQQLLAAGIFHCDDLAWIQGIPSWQPLKLLIEVPVAAIPVIPVELQALSPTPVTTKRSSNRLATGMAAFAMFHSNETRKELRDLNQNLEEHQSDADANNLSDGGSCDFS